MSFIFVLMKSAAQKTLRPGMSWRTSFQSQDSSAIDTFQCHPAKRSSRGIAAIPFPSAF